MRKIILVLTSLLLSGVLAAQETYMVNLTVHNNNELLGNPSLVVETNKEASISVGELYNISFKVEERKDEAIYVPFNLNIKGKDYSPSLVVKVDKKASIEVGEMKLSVLVSKTRT